MTPGLDGSRRRATVGRPGRPVADEERHVVDGERARRTSASNSARSRDDRLGERGEQIAPAGVQGEPVARVEPGAERRRLRPRRGAVVVLGDEVGASCRRRRSRRAASAERAGPCSWTAADADHGPPVVVADEVDPRRSVERRIEHPRAVGVEVRRVDEGDVVVDGPTPRSRPRCEGRRRRPRRTAAPPRRATAPTASVVTRSRSPASRSQPVEHRPTRAEQRHRSCSPGRRRPGRPRSGRAVVGQRARRRAARSGRSSGGSSQAPRPPTMATAPASSTRHAAAPPSSSDLTAAAMRVHIDRWPRRASAGAAPSRARAAPRTSTHGTVDARPRCGSPHHTAAPASTGWWRPSASISGPGSARHR